MEELVLTEAIAWVAEVKSLGHTLDVGDIAAYALNRLPPVCYRRRASYQRLRATEELQG